MIEETTKPMPEKSSQVISDIQTSRRTLLKGLLGFVGALGMGSFIYGGYRFLAPDAGAYASVEISINDVPTGGTYPFQFGTSPGLLLRAEDGSLKAFSLVCTHLACTVNWNPEKRTFYCPCHDGLFDAEGYVISGPPPTPLERLKVEARGDKVIVGAA